MLVLSINKRKSEIMKIRKGGGSKKALGGIQVKEKIKYLVREFAEVEKIDD